MLPSAPKFGNGFDLFIWSWLQKVNYPLKVRLYLKYRYSHYARYVIISINNGDSSILPHLTLSAQIGGGHHAYQSFN